MGGDWEMAAQMVDWHRLVRGHKEGRPKGWGGEPCGMCGVSQHLAF